MDDDEYRAYVEGIIRDSWDETYFRAYRLLLSEQPVDRDHTAWLVRQGFLRPDIVTDFWYEPQTFQHVHELALEAVRQGRLWPYDHALRRTRKLLLERDVQGPRTKPQDTA